MTDYQLKTERIQAFKVMEEAPIFPVLSVTPYKDACMLHTAFGGHEALKGDYCVIKNSIITEILSPERFYKKYEKKEE